MKPIHLTILLAVLSALLLPQCAHAQWSDCNYFACESYAYYDSSNGGVYGYSRTFDGGWWPFWLTVSSDLYEPGSEWPLSSDQAADYGEATAYVEGFPDNAGTINVEGQHGYWLEDEEDPDGESEYYVQVGMIPYIEPGPETVNDGDSGSFYAEAFRGNPTSYSWSFDSWPGGNSPWVDFSNPSGSSTMTDGHWFAWPLSGSPPECSADTSSTYSIYATVSPTMESAESYLTVVVPWHVGAVTHNASLDAYVDYEQFGGGWRIKAGPATHFTRYPASMTMYTPWTSQFYNKNETHENVHVSQFEPGGLFGGTYDPAVAYSRIIGLTDTSQSALSAQVAAALAAYGQEQIQFISNNLATAEYEAYRVSEQIDPKYLYQGYCLGY